MTRTALLALLALVTLEPGCSEDPTAPSADGPVTFSALVDGHRWAPTDTSMILASFGPHSGLTVAAQRGGTGPSSEAIVIRSANALGLGDYPLTRFNGAPDAYYAAPTQSGASQPVYSTNDTHTGMLHITGLDTASRMIAGTYSFSGVRPDGRVISVVGGHFRARYFANP